MAGKLMLDCMILASDCCIAGTFFSLGMNLVRTRSAAGLSLQSVTIVVSARVFHAFAHVLGIHYTPGAVPSIFFALTDIVGFLAGIGLAAYFWLQLRNTYEKEKDNFGALFFQKFNLLKEPWRSSPIVSASFLYMCTFVLAAGLHMFRRHAHDLKSYFRCYYEVISSVALLPQLWMFQKDKRVPKPLALFVVLTAAARFLTFMFWFFYPMVHPNKPLPPNRGVQMFSEAFNILILSDFLFYWARSMVRGDREIIIGDGVPTPDV